MVQVRVIQTSLLREAEEVLRRLRQGRVSFAELAQTFPRIRRARAAAIRSLCARRLLEQGVRGGGLSLKIGEISGVISTDQGISFSKSGGISEKRQPLAEVRARIEQRLRKEKTDRARTAFIDSLRSNRPSNPRGNPAPHNLAAAGDRLHCARRGRLGEGRPHPFPSMHIPGFRHAD
jgi:hypothetical protein